jgi:hypothetical protein
VRDGATFDKMPFLSNVAARSGVFHAWEEHSTETLTVLERWVFLAILRDRVKAGIAQARQEGRPHGRPATVRRHADNVRKLHNEGVSKSEIARRLSVSRTSVRRLLEL